MVYLCSKFPFPSSSGSLVIAARLKAKCMLLFYILQRIALTEVKYFLKVCYHKKFQSHTLSGVGVSLTLKGHTTIVLILFTTAVE